MVGDALQISGADPDDPLVRKRATINPYRAGLWAIRQRIIWDFYPQSWVSRARIRRLKDKHCGEKAVILCNGPSLLNADLSLLNGVFTFGLNKVNLLFSKNPFRPSWVVAVNPFVIEQNTEFYNNTDITLFLDWYGARKSLIKLRKNVSFLHSYPLPDGFAKDCSFSVCQGHTVTYVAMQLAFHMGFREVALIGADHSYATKGPANKTVVSGKEDRSHFHPGYFSGGDKWQLPDLFGSEVAYTRAKNMYLAYGREIVNCTDGGKLDVFRRVSLEDFI